MIVLKVIYYLFPIFFILANIVKLSDTKKYINFGKNILDENNKSKEDRDEDLVVKSCLFAGYAIMSFLWNISVFFTYNYEFALIMIPFAYLLGKIFYRKDAGATFVNLAYIKFAVILSIIYYAFLIINSFHLHIQLGLFDYLKGLF